MTVDFDALVNAQCNETFGVTVLYKPKGHTAFDLSVIFDEAWQSISGISRGGISMPVSTTKPRVGCRGRDFPSGVVPQQGDTFMLNDRRYTVTDAQPDGVSGWYALNCL